MCSLLFAYLKFASSNAAATNLHAFIAHYLFCHWSSPALRGPPLSEWWLRELPASFRQQRRWLWQWHFESISTAVSETKSINDFDFRPVRLIWADKRQTKKKCANARSDWLCSFNIVAFIHLYTTSGGGAPLDPKKGVVQCGGFTWGNPIMAYNFQLLALINPTISNEFKLPCLQTRHHRCLHRRLGPIITQIEGGKFELVKGLVGVDFGLGQVRRAWVY